MMIKSYRKFMLLLAFAMVVLLANHSFAGLPPVVVGPPPPPGGGGPTCWPPPCIPIDGGIGVLVAAGLALGGRKLWKRPGKTA